LLDREQGLLVHGGLRGKLGRGLAAPSAPGEQEPEEHRNPESPGMDASPHARICEDGNRVESHGHLLVVGLDVTNVRRSLPVYCR
jgi:hypothetical protein